MKNIIKIILAFTFLLFSSFAFSQDVEKDSIEKETMTLDIKVKSTPTSVIISSEALEKNEALQQMLNISNRNSIYLNNNLYELNKTFNSLPMKELEARATFLNKQGINIKETNRVNKLIDFWCTVAAVLISYLFIIFEPKYLYSEKTNSMISKWIFVLFTFIIVYKVFPAIIKFIVLPEYELLNMFQKVF